MTEPVIGGRYRHYKGFEYVVLAVARHSETLEELVVYQAQYGNGEIWARPKSMFLECVTQNGITQPRFQFLGISDKSPECLR